MIFREAIPDDIEGLHRVRMSVAENALSDPSLINGENYLDYLTRLGKGWCCSIENEIVGFAIADLHEHNIWALFVHPEHEKKGIGKKLHDMMLHWYFSQTSETVWLGTAPHTRAEQFYRLCGWKETGYRKNGELRFEMNYARWKELSEQTHHTPSIDLNIPE